MTIFSGWNVEIGGFASVGSGSVTAYGTPTDAIDFTNRVKSLKVDNQAYLGKVGRTTTQVVLDNNDGALTPEGGGTYTSKDWFAEPLHIVARIGTSYPAAIEATDSGRDNPYFSGPINDFKFNDNGYESTVTLTAVDWGTFLSRFTFQAAASQTGNIQTVYYELTEDMRPYVSKYGATSNVTIWSALHQDTDSSFAVTVTKGDYLGDVSNSLIASDGGTVLPPILAYDAGSTTSSVTYIAGVILREYLTSSNAEEYPVIFNGTTGALGSTELPIKNLNLAFNDEEFITQAEVNRSGGTAQFSYNNTGSTTWGPRSISINDVYLATDAESLALAEWYTNRFNEVNFVPSSCEITGSMIESKCADAALEYVKRLIKTVGNVDTILWRPLKVTWTGAGGTSNTKNVLANRVTLTATPTDWKIRLGTVDAVTNGAFILNSTTQGVLNTNKVG